LHNNTPVSTTQTKTWGAPQDQATRAGKIRVAVVGPTGYTGLKLIQLLLRHPGARLTYLASHREQLPHIAEVFPQLGNTLPDGVTTCRPIDPGAIAGEADVAMLALPHRAAMGYVPQLLDKNIRVIDLSADYRFTSAASYEAAYDHPHTDPERLTETVYGLTELFRPHLAGANLIANPGCYPTAAALAIAPILRAGLAKPHSITINAASGVTGAGKGLAPHLHFAEQNQAFGPYGQIGAHRHQPEINQTLSAVAGCAIDTLFVPHLLPVDCGIMETIYLEPVGPELTQDRVFDTLEQAYRDEPFVRVRTDLPNIKHVVGTNFCDIAARLVTTGDTKRIVLFSAIDNLIKGAAGQAIQNMNAAYGLDETTGLL